MEALQNLIDLLDEDQAPVEELGCRATSLANKSRKMPALRSNCHIESFLDLIHKDISAVKWKTLTSDNVTRSDRDALHDLQQATNIIIKPNDKGGNVVILDEQMYTNEAERLLRDKTTYTLLPSNPFGDIVEHLNFKLFMAKDENLLTQKEFEYLQVK